jgi:hypothetical protein
MTEIDVIELTKEFFSKPPEILFTMNKTLVVIFTRNGGGNYPIVGAYFNNKEWIPCAWLDNGAFGSVNDLMSTTGLDICLPPRPSNVTPIRA